MPELAEVETVRRELMPWLTGRTVRAARLVHAAPGPRYAGLPRVVGQRILAVSRRGKFLLLPLSEGDEMVIHLGMTGAISSTDTGRHVRVLLELDGPPPQRLYFEDMRRFGRLLVVSAGDYETLPTLAHMGPEPLGPGFDTPTFRSLLQSRGPIKTYLLSQRPVAGLGNIYVDECLWRARIHPLAPARTVSRRKVAALREAIVEVLTAAVAAGGTTFRDFRSVGGEQGQYVEQLKVYQRTGEPCPRCSRAIGRIVVGGRSTHFCSRCQRRSRAARK